MSSVRKRVTRVEDKCMECHRMTWGMSSQWRQLCIWWQDRLMAKTRRIMHTEHFRQSTESEGFVGSCMGEVWPLYMMMIFISAAAFFRQAFVTKKVRMKVLSKVLSIAREAMASTGPASKDVKGGNEEKRSYKRETESGMPRSQQEMKEAARSARAEAVKWELLAMAAGRGGTNSEPEDTGRGEPACVREGVISHQDHQAEKQRCGRINRRKTRSE